MNPDEEREYNAMYACVVYSAAIRQAREELPAARERYEAARRYYGYVSDAAALPLTVLSAYRGALPL